MVADGGSGTLAYQWQQSTDGGSNWSNMPGETSATLTLFAVVDAMNGYQYRVMISTGACSAVTSDVATLTVEGPIAVSQQPMSETVCSGEDVTFEIVPVRLMVQSLINGIAVPMVVELIQLWLEKPAVR